MNDRDDFAELIGKFNRSRMERWKRNVGRDLFLGSARAVLKSSSLYFNGRIRYGTKGERVEERLLVLEPVLQSVNCQFFILVLVYGCSSNLHLLDKNSRESNHFKISIMKSRCFFFSHYLDRITIQYSCY